MIPFTLKLSTQQKIALQKAQLRAEALGDIGKVKRILSILLLSADKSISEISDYLLVSTQAIRDWIKRYIYQGLYGLRSGKSPGRPSKLTKSQRKQLKEMILAGPEATGYPGACWRTPMIQHLIMETFGVFYSARYLSELLHNLGLSYQKATFVADKQDQKARDKWLKETFPEIIALAGEKNAYVLFGDEASFPQWGTLSYTWALKGKQPVIKTSGTRRSYKVFGLIDYFTGKFFSKGYEGKLNGESYVEFLRGVMSKTRKHIILIQDGAPYHKGKVVTDFIKANKQRLTIYTLPSYSPDFNPIERLWKKLKEKGVHLKFFPTFDDLKNTVDNMLDFFGDVKKEVLSLFGFYNKLVA